jgi:hypothetical protein
MRNSPRLKLVTILLGCCLIIAVFLAEAMTRGWCQPAPPAHEIEEPKSDAGAHEEKKQEDEKAWRAWFMKDAAGAFTAAMFFVALAQAGLFFYQLKYMRIGLGDSSRAAKAATTAATEAQAANRPFLIHKLALLEVETGNPIGDQVLGAAILDVAIENVGSMPAIIETVEIGWVVLDRLPEAAMSGWRQHGLQPHCPLVQGRPRSVQDKGFKVVLTDCQRNAILDGKKSLWVFGAIHYKNLVDEDVIPYRFGLKYRFVETDERPVGFTHEDVPEAYFPPIDRNLRSEFETKVS